MVVYQLSQARARNVGMFRGIIDVTAKSQN